MKLAILSTALAGAAAFAPASVERSSTSLSATKKVGGGTKSILAGSRSLVSENPTGLIGDLPPVGFFDPAGFAAKASPEELTKYRQVSSYLYIEFIINLQLEKYEHMICLTFYLQHLLFDLIG